MSEMLFIFILLAPAVVAPADEAAELRRLAISLNSVIGATAQDTKVDELLKNPAQARKLVELAKSLNEDKSSPLNYPANFILGNVAMELRDVASGEALFGAAVKQAEQLKSDEKLVLATLSWVDLNIQAKRFDEAERLTQKLLEREADEDSGRWYMIGQAFGLRKLVQIAAYRGKIDEALKKLENDKFDQSNEFIRETKAWVLGYAGKLDEAIEIYAELVKATANRESQAAAHERYSRMLSSMYGDQGNLEKATAALEPLLKKNPDDDGLNNDLGYLWADHGHKLDEAERMIKKALDAKPDNSSYLDSYAWVLFKQKKYEEAKKYMQKAMARPRGNTMELYEHLGAIHAALGEKEEAKAAWRKALEDSTGSARDKKRQAEIEKRLKELE